MEGPDSQESSTGSGEAMRPVQEAEKTGVNAEASEKEKTDLHTNSKPKCPNDKESLDSQSQTSGCSESQLKPGKHSDNQESADDDYESEPASLEKVESHKKSWTRTFRGNQGKTVYPRMRSTSKEMRELSRKHAQLEKNLKIDGLPDPPKFRKRRLSLSSNMGRPHDKDVPYKRKRLASVDTRPKRDHMPKWELMGGDANDPLNLNGLAHSEEGRLLNLKTPESSPLPTPDFRKIVYVKVPPNIEDPLNLEGKHDQRVLDKMLSSTIKKRHRSKKKKHDESQPGMSADATASVTTLVSDPQEGNDTSPSLPESQIVSKATGDLVETETQTPTKTSGRSSRSRSLSMSPERKFRRQVSGSKNKGAVSEPTKYPEKPQFTFGNYNRYYGYRNRDHEPDPRLQYFDPLWFKEKDVLDIGCNVGHITLAIAEHFHPHKILGMDIDGKLIQAARQNIRHMLSQRRKDSAKYPRVLEMTRGPLEAHPLMGSSDNFPNNVLFLQGNYVPGSEEILKLQKEEYDTILALSITKWIHLNNGDQGLKLFFQKIFRQLRPGGRLILEPQPWSTYRKRAKLSPELFSKYQTIKLKPEAFKHYLLSIGFVKCEVIGVPVTKAKGFRRPLILFTKADNKQTPSVLATEDFDVRDVCQECGNSDKSQCEHAQFAGMRRGPYASHMYDHIGYPNNSSSESPYMPSSSRTYSSYSYSFNVPSMEEGGMMPPYGGGASAWVSQRGEAEGDFCDNSVMSNNVRWSNNGSSGSSSSSLGSGSQTSSSSSGSSCSSSTTSGSGTTGSSASFFSPDHNGPNGDIAGEVYSPNLPEPDNLIVNNSVEGGLNGDIVHEGDSPDNDGPHLDLLDANLNPGPDGPDGDVVEDVMWDGDDVAAAAAGDLNGVVLDEENEDFVQPVHGHNSMNGDHELNVIQWDDNQDANMDAPLVGHGAHGWLNEDVGAAHGEGGDNDGTGGGNNVDDNANCL